MTGPDGIGVDGDGNLVDVVDYDAFGGIVSESNPSVGDRYKYTGREYDLATGLYHYRARGYDPDSKTFLQEDPLGLAAGDTNEYRYVFNQPTNFRDPTGMTALTGYAVTVGRIAGNLIGGPWRICVSDKSVRLTMDFTLPGTSVNQEVGMVISSYGLTVPKTPLLSMCVESCARIYFAAFSNAVFGVCATALNWFNVARQIDIAVVPKLSMDGSGCLNRWIPELPGILESGSTRFSTIQATATFLQWEETQSRDARRGWRVS